jgi:hypothetical protein
VVHLGVGECSPCRTALLSEADKKQLIRISRHRSSAFETSLHDSIDTPLLADELHLSSCHIVHRAGNFDASLFFQFLQDWTASANLGET